MNDPGCGLLFVIVWLGYIAYENYKVWFKPDETWHQHRGRVARYRSRYSNSILSIFGFDARGFENDQHRFLWFFRFGFGLFLVFGILVLIIAVGQVMR